MRLLRRYFECGQSEVRASIFIINKTKENKGNDITTIILRMDKKKYKTA